MIFQLLKQQTKIMKTIRLIVLATLLLPAIVSNAQTNQGPTLAETADWLTKYLDAYGDKIRTCSSSSEYPMYNMKFDYERKMIILSNGRIKIEIIPGKITSIKNGYCTSSDIIMNVVWPDDILKKSEWDAKCSSFYLVLKEGGDYSKLDKAMKRLAELCGAKLLNEDLF